MWTPTSNQHVLDVCEGSVVLSICGGGLHALPSVGCVKLHDRGVVTVVEFDARQCQAAHGGLVRKHTVLPCTRRCSFCARTLLAWAVAGAAGGATCTTPSITGGGQRPEGMQWAKLSVLQLLWRPTLGILPRGGPKWLQHPPSCAHKASFCASVFATIRASLRPCGSRWRLFVDVPLCRKRLHTTGTCTAAAAAVCWPAAPAG